MEPRKAHWDAMYQRCRPDEVSWYQPRLKVSLRLLANAGLKPESRVIDVGGGVSTLADDLLAQGARHVTVLDISGQALTTSKARLGKHAAQVTWLETDVTRAELPAAGYDLWHDRAVFHFLTDAEGRRRYCEVMRRALAPAGQTVLATFSLQGPPRCSGLEVVRYSAQTLQAELGGGFALAETAEEEHRTPAQATQAFLYCRFQKIP